MEHDFASLHSEELIELYYTTNSELSKNLLSGAPWHEQQERIAILTQISRELTQRKVDLQTMHANKLMIKTGK